MFTPFLATLALVTTGQVQVEPEALNRSFIGQKIQMEGLCTSVLGKGDRAHFRLRGCRDVKFVPQGVRLDGIQGEIVDLTGTVKSENGDLVCEVMQLRILPSNMQQYTDRVRFIAPDDFQSWYELSSWAAKRAKRYDSEEMAKRADTAYQSAVAIERRLAAGNVAKLRGLRNRIKQDGTLKSYDFADLDHEILRAEFEDKRTWTVQELRDFSDKVGNAFGASAELAPLAKPLQNQYDSIPVPTFSRAGSEERQKLARYWQVSLLQRAFQEAVKAGELTPIEVAKQASNLLKDYPDTTKVWRQQAVDSYLENPAALSKDQVLEFVQLYEGPESQKDLLKQWLRAKERQLQQLEQEQAGKARRNGVEPVRNAQARMELAAHYNEWFPDDTVLQEQQKRLLREAAKIDPDLLEAKVKLRQLGETMVAQPRSEKANRGARTGFRIGMKDSEIPAEPDYKARIVTAGKVMHQWIYRGLAGSQTTYVILERNGSGTLIVSDIRN